MSNTKNPAQYDGPASEQYDEKGNARHYEARINPLIQIERVWGTYEAMIFCEITAFKYRTRMGKKPGQSLDQELKKANWYEERAKELNEKLLKGEVIYPPNELRPMFLEVKADFTGEVPEPTPTITTAFPYGSALKLPDEICQLFDDTGLGPFKWINKDGSAEVLDGDDYHFILQKLTLTIYVENDYTPYIYIEHDGKVKFNQSVSVTKTGDSTAKAKLKKVLDELI